MANKRAIQNGNWNSSSTWDGGVVPAADDDVWLNGYTVTLNVDITAKSISNGELEDFSVIGGTLACGNNARVINSSLHHYVSNLITQGNNLLTINGDIYLHSSANYCIQKSGIQNNVRFILNGNVVGDTHDCKFLSMNNNSGSYNSYIEIVGNITNCMIDSKLYSGNYTKYISIVGNVNDLQLQEDTGLYSVSIVGNLRQQAVTIGDLDDFSIYGELHNYTNDIPYFKTLYIGGNVFYNNGLGGFCSKSISYINDDIIFTNTTDLTYIVYNSKKIDETYPSENTVAQGVIYGMQNKYEGRLQLPQPSTVLKDVEYGDKVGTLEVIALSGATAQADNISVVNLTEQQVNRVSQCATKETVDEAFEEFISESATIIGKASVITGDATVIKGDVAAVNLTREQIERIKNCATVSTVQRCFSDFKNKK